MSEMIEVDSSLEDQLLDAQKHVGRLEHELAMLKAGLGLDLRWTKTPPMMSGVYANCHYFDRIIQVDGEEAIAGWTLVSVFPGGGMIKWQAHELGPWWAGPLKIEAPHGS